MAGEIVTEYRELDRFPGYRFGSDGSVWSRKRQGNAPDADTWRLKRQSTNRKGYKSVWLSAPSGGATYPVHVLILLAFKGECPAGMECAHDNGNPSDNRLDNLRWATPKENWADKRRHGTAIEGDRCHWAELSRGDVETIVARKQCGHTYRAIADDYGVTPQAIWNIVRGKTWKSVTGGAVTGAKNARPNVAGEANPIAKLTDDAVREIRKLLAAGARRGAIASQFGISTSKVSHIATGRSWRHVQ